MPPRSVTTFVVSVVSSAASGTGITSGNSFTFTGVQSGLSMAPRDPPWSERIADAAATDQRWTLADRAGSFGNRDRLPVARRRRRERPLHTHHRGTISGGRRWRGSRSGAAPSEREENSQMVNLGS